MWEYIVCVIGGLIIGLIIGILIGRYIVVIRDKKNIKCSELLIKNFGSPMVTNNFTLNEVKDWFSLRQEKIIDGKKGVVLKINKKAFEQIGFYIDIDSEVDHFLLLGVYYDGKFLESLLIRFNTLDDGLLTALKDGVMVIEA